MIGKITMVWVIRASIATRSMGYFHLRFIKMSLIQRNLNNNVPL